MFVQHALTFFFFLYILSLQTQRKEEDTMYNPNEYTRAMLDEERRLMREVSTGRFGWKKIGKMIQLNALLRAHRTNY